jgi:DNA/RNA-binding domain of Phe-tRNA-synthetase-like protein
MARFERRGATPFVSWQDAYRAFGAKPQHRVVGRALWKRAAGPGLPRVNWLVDVYNAVSVAHVLPVGGEDLAHYGGAIRLVRATGAEPFDTMKDGQPASDPPALAKWCGPTISA